MHVPAFEERVTKGQKRLVAGPDTQALLPLAYPWLYDQYKNGIQNLWTPEEIGMAEDKLQYPDLPPNLKRQYDYLLSMLTTMDMFVTDAVATCLQKHASAPELRQWLSLQQFQEALHSDSYAYIIQEIGLDQDEVFNRYLTEPTLYAKIELAQQYMGLAEKADPSTTEGMADLIVAYTFLSLMFEGVWFLLGLSAGSYASKQAGLMRGTEDQFTYIRRDEILHVSTGLQVIRALIEEHPEAWTDMTRERILAMVRKSMKAENEFVKATYRGLPQLTAEDYMEQARFQAEKLLRRLQLSLYPEAKETLPWLSIEQRRETNFFERRVTEYRKGVDLAFGAQVPINEIDGWQETD